MFKAIAEKFFHRHAHEDELLKLQQIAERAQQFEQSVIESMRASYGDIEPQLADAQDPESQFK